MSEKEEHILELRSILNVLNIILVANDVEDINIQDWAYNSCSKLEKAIEYFDNPIITRIGQKTVACSNLNCCEYTDWSNKVVK